MRVDDLKNRQIVQPFFLTKIDEDKLSNELRNAFPSIKISDDNRWATSSPVLCNSIANCSSNYAFLWPSDLLSDLSVRPVGAQFEGPQTSVVMQFMRSRQIDNCLMSGQLGVGFYDTDPWMPTWSRSVVGILRKLNVAKLKSVGLNSTLTGAYVIGADAEKFLKEGGCFRHNTADVTYELA